MRRIGIRGRIDCIRVLFAEYLVWDTPFRVGSHHYARHFLDLGWEVGWLGGEFHPFNVLNNRPELARKFPLWRAGGLWSTEGTPSSPPLLQGNAPSSPPLLQGRGWGRGDLWQYASFKLLPYRRWGPLDREGLAWQGDRWALPPVRRVLARVGFDHADLLWLTNVHAYPWLVRQPGYRAVVYRAADDHAAFAASPRSLSAVEEAVVRRAGAVFAVSHAVYERLRRVRSEGVYHLPNGVDLGRFQAVQPRPPEYVDLRRPIAVYVGAIHYWFDLDVLAEVARRRDDVTFILIGQAHVPLTRLTELSNVHFLGTRPPERLPAYLQHADVGLIPFVRSPLTDSINPLKMYEYLACGLPVVSTDMAEVRAMAAPVYIAQDVARMSVIRTFCDALDAALSITDADRETYRAYAARHTWQARYAQVDAVVERLLG